MQFDVLVFTRNIFGRNLDGTRSTYRETRRIVAPSSASAVATLAKAIDGEHAYYTSNAGRRKIYSTSAHEYVAVRVSAR